MENTLHFLFRVNCPNSFSRFEKLYLDKKRPHFEEDVLQEDLVVFEATRYLERPAEYAIPLDQFLIIFWEETSHSAKTILDNFQSIELQAVAVWCLEEDLSIECNNPYEGEQIDEGFLLADFGKGLELLTEPKCSEIDDYYEDPILLFDKCIAMSK